MVRIIVGFIYGVLLAYMGFVLGAGGHGVISFVMLVSSPLPGYGLVLLPVTCAGAAWLAGSQHPKIFVLAMFAIYVIGFIPAAYAVYSDFYDDYRRFPASGYRFLIFGLALYVAGNALLWGYFTSKRPLIRKI